MCTSEPIAITVGFPQATSDAQSLILGLREVILRTRVDHVRPAPAPSAAGTRSGEVLTVGALVVTLAPAAVESLLSAVTAWLTRQPTTIEIEIDGHRLRGPVTRAQRDALIAHYLRHTASRATPAQPLRTPATPSATPS
ncbi:hypothetical protein Ade02nite_56900 [Paractinoplanes deccanensis]|uniref:Uncharacterized protein n=1 Tax=Paractinoplanes deccanensis TaxID=113561 RepID=A0ABQ3YAM0_9ACTN|nr:hypothetical protein [Actinoplanes deccanensis]GID77049.1 hypothetical protein Ade02nite_56900 [Actinoplanes deccanensis]